MREEFLLKSDWIFRDTLPAISIWVLGHYSRIPFIPSRSANSLYNWSSFNFFHYIAFLVRTIGARFRLADSVGKDSL